MQPVVWTAGDREYDAIRNRGFVGKTKLRISLWI